MNSGPMQEDRPPVGPTAGSFAAWLRSWRYFFYVLGLLLLIAMFYAEEDWRGPWLWQRYQRQREARGDQFDAKVFIPPLVPDDQNFAMTPALAPLFQFLPGTQQRGNSNGFQRAQNLISRYSAASGNVRGAKGPRSNSWVSPHLDLPAWYAALLNSTNLPSRRGAELSATNFTVAQAAAGVLAELSEYAPLVEELTAACARPYSRFNLHYEEENPAAILLPHLSVLKQLCQLLQLISSAELELGRTEDAYHHLNLALCLADQCREEPILISQLVRFSKLQLVLLPLAEGLAEHRWSEPQLRALQEKLQHFDFLADTRRSLESERVFFAGTIIDYFRREPGKYEQIQGNSSDGLGLIWSVIPNGWFSLERLNYDRACAEHIIPVIDLDQHRIAPRQAHLAEERIASLVSNAPPVLLLRHRYFSSLLLPALPGIFQKTAYAQTAVESAALACALERYRLAHGRFPDSLDALVPGFVPKPPHDLINGLPLNYRRTDADQYVLYSVGWNERDDGGRVGLSKTGETVDLKEGDWVWR
jgi:hypothetical protein